MGVIYLKVASHRHKQFVFPEILSSASPCSVALSQVCTLSSLPARCIAALLTTAAGRNARVAVP